MVGSQSSVIHDGQKDSRAHVGGRADHTKDRSSKEMPSEVDTSAIPGAHNSARARRGAAGTQMRAEEQDNIPCDRGNRAHTPPGHTNDRRRETRDPPQEGADKDPRPDRLTMTGCLPLRAIVESLLALAARLWPRLLWLRLGGFWLRHLSLGPETCDGSCRFEGRLLLWHPPGTPRAGPWQSPRVLP